MFTKNGYLTPAQAPNVHQPGAQLLLPAHVPGTSILDTQATPPVRTSVPKQVVEWGWVEGVAAVNLD